MKHIKKITVKNRNIRMEECLVIIENGERKTAKDKSKHEWTTKNKNKTRETEETYRKRQQ